MSYSGRLVCFAVVAVLAAGCGGGSGRVAPDVIGANSRFGAAVEVTDDFKFVGAPGHGGSGTVLVFERPAGGQPTASMTPFQGVTGDLFGTALSARGDAILVGAPVSELDGILAGRAFVYRYSPDQDLWLQEEDLAAVEPHDLDRFGASVALSRDLAVVGAPGDDEIGSNAGAAYVYAFDGAGWTYLAKLIPQDGNVGDRFGESVAIGGNRVIVGSPYAVHEATRPGAAYVFAVSDTSVILERRLDPESINSDQGFGSSVALSGSHAFVGAPGGGNPEATGGTVSIFDLNTDSAGPASTLVGGSTSTEAGFGASIDMDGEFLMIGAQRPVGDHAGPGSAYIFSGSGAAWQLLSDLPGSDAARADGFGGSVAIKSGAAAVGAAGDSGSGPDAGAAYFYTGDSGGWY